LAGIVSSQRQAQAREDRDHGHHSRVADARELARQSLLRAQRGIDPAEERRQAISAAAREAEETAVRVRDTLGAVIDRYLAERAKPRMRPDYFKESRRALLVDVKAVLGSGRPIRAAAPRQRTGKLSKTMAGRSTRRSPGALGQNADAD
jgi:hypothetical protein